MNTIMRGNNGITLVSLETKLLQSRKIYIQGEITDEMMIEFFQKMQILVENDDQAPISIYIDSAGGEIQSGLAMYNIITTCKTEIDIYVLGKACSMAAILLASGKKGHRFLMPYSEVMIHEPLIRNRIGGSTSSMKSIAKTLQDSKELLDKILAVHTGHSIEEVREATNFEHYYKAEEAIEWGLADKIVGFGDMMGEDR